MNNLNFDGFTTTPQKIPPYEEIGDGVVLAYDKHAFQKGTFARVHRAGPASLIIDCHGFKDQWFGLEIALGDSFKNVQMRLRAYPAAYFYPRVYFAGGQRDLVKVECSSEPFDLNFTSDHIRNVGVPENATNKKLSLLVPSADWFVLDMQKLEVCDG